MGWQDAPLATQQTPKAPGWQSAPMAEEPDLAGANKSLARTVGDAMKPSLQTVEDVGSVYAPIETALNASTGLLFGFPAYIGGAIGGLADKYLLGEDVDPKQMAETISKVFTYIPQTERGKRLTGNVMQPLDWLQQGAQYAGEKVSGALAKTELPTNVAAGAGAVTDSTIQMLPALLLSALGRRMGGNIPASEDFSNTAKVIAGKDAAPATVAAAESSLRSTYAETGIDPFTVAEAAAKEPALAAEVLSPEGATPKSIMALTQEAKGLSAETEAGGTPPAAAAPSGQPRGPLLDVSGETMDEARAAAPAASALEQRIADPGIRAELQNMRGETGWAEVGGRLVRSEGREGEVTGRTSWIPNADWWPGRPKGLTEIQTRAAIDKALAGEPLNAKETRFVDYATQIADENIRSSAHAPTADELSSADLGPKDALDVSMVARASELDEGAVERLSVAHEGDDAAFMRGIKEMLDANDQNAKTAIGGQAGIAEAQPAAAGAAAGRSASPAAATGAREATGIVELGAGVSPAAAARAYAETYTPFVGVEAPEKFKQPGGIMDSFQKVMAPAARGPIAEQQAGIMRANFGEMAHEREVALEKLRDFAADFDKAPVEENYKFIDAMEHGTKLGDPKLQAAADGIRALLDQKREQVQALGKGQLENFVQNYFPHIWQDEGAAQAFYARRPLTGSGAFLKERTYDLFKDGIDAGLTPISDNPVELALLKAREMDRYIYGQNIFGEMKDAGLARFVRFGEKPPVGWTKINDKVARVFQYSEPEQGMIMRGDYYAPDQAATLINNHLSPGLQGNSMFNAWRRTGMAMNSLQLGMSAFHVGFTTLDAMTSRIALGIEQVSRGDVLKGVGNIAAGASPTQPFDNIYKGDRLLRAYLGNLDDPDLAPIVQAIQDAGGRVRMDDFYRSATVNGFKQAIRRGDVGTAAKELLPTVLDRVNAPIFEWLVPRQKLGVFFDMAKDWLERNPDATVDERRAGMAKAWDSVDNRMGQLVYDNVFWNRAIKDGLMATVRSVGWNLGTFRELGGGVMDAKDLLTGSEMSHRTAYVVALPLLAGLYGAAVQYAYTGEGPREMKDLYFPRTGRIRPDGSEDRVSLPTYMKDVYAYGEDVSSFVKYGTNPLQTLENKAHPLISTISQMLNNADFYGGTIRNPAAPITMQVEDEANYLLKQIEPFSLRNYQQQAKLRGAEPSVGDYVTSPSMFGVVPSPGYITKSEAEKESEAVSKLRDPLIRKFRQEVRDGGDVDKLVQEMLNAGLSPKDIKFVIRTSGETPRPHKLKSFGKGEE